ncbi:MAG TPA: TadE family protein [Acidimicrobiales bacterium]|nr:TadE family protein [Acidimicrobiales bacterium]
MSSRLDRHRWWDRWDRRGDESGQSLVEFALVVPIVVLLMGTAFNGWSAMELSVRLTSAARAGAIEAASSLSASTASQPPTRAQIQAAQDAATNAVNAEEGVTGVYQDANPSGNDYVGISTSQQVHTGQNPSEDVTVDVVTIMITQPSVAILPFVKDFTVAVHATARYA